MAETVKMTKVNIGVVLSVSMNGEVRPIGIKWPDGRNFIVDKVLDVKPSACLEAGVAGTKYQCRICGKEIPIYDDGGKWFLIKKTA